MAFEPFDLGRVLQTAEGIKAQRRSSVIDDLQARYLGGQIKGQEQQQTINATNQQAQVDKATASRRYLEADAILRAENPHEAVTQFAPELIQHFEANHGQGSFATLPPEAVKQMAQVAKEKAGAIAGFQQIQTIKGENGGVVQQDATGAQKEIVSPQRPVPPDHFEAAEAGRNARAAAAAAAAAAKNKETDTNKDRQDMQKLRKEFRSLPSVKEYETVLPLVESAKKAPDTGYGDLQMIYTVGKVLDPGSVVREGELSLVIKSGSLMEQLLGGTRLQLQGKGRIRPEMRQKMLDMLKERVDTYGQAYKRDYDQFSTYATEGGFTPGDVVGTPASSAFETPKQSKVFKHSSGATVEIIE